MLGGASSSRAVFDRHSSPVGGERSCPELEDDGRQNKGVIDPPLTSAEAVYLGTQCGRWPLLLKEGYLLSLIYQ